MDKTSIRSQRPPRLGNWATITGGHPYYQTHLLRTQLRLRIPYTGIIGIIDAGYCIDRQLACEVTPQFRLLQANRQTPEASPAVAAGR
jgi:hypothetical protein